MIFRLISPFSQSDKCFPIEIQFQNLSQNAPFHFWEFGDGNFSTDINPIHIYNSVPSDSIFLTVSDNNGCLKTIGKSMIDFISPSFSQNETAGCSPLEVQFTNNSIGYDSITWIVNDSVVSNQASPSLSFVNEGYYDVSLLLHSDQGCTDTLKKDSLIYVSNPIASYTIDDSLVCKPAIINIINHSENISNFIWKFGDGSSSISENPVHIYNESGVYNTSLVGISAIGCKDTFELGYPLTVQGPEAIFFLASTNVCEPKSIWFNDSSTNAYFWFWDFGDGYTSTIQQPVHHYAQSGVYNVSLIVNDSIGCSSIYEYPNGVNIFDYTSINYSLDRTIGCAPMEINLALPLNYSDSVLIDFGDGNFGTKHTTSHIYNQAGKYQIKFIRINEWGCRDTTYSDTITVIQQPTAKFKVEGGIGCAPIKADIIDLTTNLFNASYIWDLGTLTTFQDSSFQMIYNNTGIYDLSLIVINDSMCSDTFTIINAIQAYNNSIPFDVKTEFVSVVDNNSVEVQWHKNAEPDIDYYNLFKLNLKSGLYEKIFSNRFEHQKLGSGSINYFSKNVSTSKYKYDYKVQAVNYCGSKIPISDILSDNSILLNIDSVSKMEFI